MENPFSLTFGQIPTEMISRDNQLNQIIDIFEMERPTNHVFMIAGIRGSGKTVSLSDVSDHFAKKDDWAVINLNPDSDMIKDSVSEINRISGTGKIDISANINIPVAGSVTIRNAQTELIESSKLKIMLDQIANKHKRVLFVIDEILINEYIKVFTGQFQIWLREGRPVYLIMTGLYENISNLQNEKTLTFLYRATKIVLKPLNISAISARYQKIFDISSEEASVMAKATKGYSFAFQILGYLKWEEKKPLDELLPDYDAALAEYSYDKIWSELSPKDKQISKIIASGKTKIGEIREELNVSSQYMNVYRNRLIASGIVSGDARGELVFALPRFENYIKLYGEL